MRLQALENNTTVRAHRPQLARGDARAHTERDQVLLKLDAHADSFRPASSNTPAAAAPTPMPDDHATHPVDASAAG